MTYRFLYNVTEISSRILSFPRKQESREIEDWIPHQVRNDIFKNLQNCYGQHTRVGYQHCVYTAKSETAAIVADTNEIGAMQRK